MTKKNDFSQKIKYIIFYITKYKNFNILVKMKNCPSLDLNLGPIAK